MKLDVESEGFAFKYQETSNNTACYEKSYKSNPRGLPNLLINVVYNPVSEWVLIATGDDETPYSDWNTLFAGRIRTQEDFQKVLSMVIV